MPRLRDVGTGEMVQQLRACIIALPEDPCLVAHNHRAFHQGVRSGCSPLFWSLLPLFSHAQTHTEAHTTKQNPFKNKLLIVLNLKPTLVMGLGRDEQSCQLVELRLCCSCLPGPRGVFSLLYSKNHFPQPMEKLKIH